MAFDFPNTPTTGQVITGPGGIQFQWDGVKWVVVNAGSPGFAPINSPQFSGDPQVPTAVYGDSDNSVSDTAFVQNAVTPLTHNIGRNLIHNALFNIWQRGTGSFTSGYTADRWLLNVSLDTSSATRAAYAINGVLGDEAAAYAMWMPTTGNAGAGSYTFISQPIEGVKRLSAKTVTVSFVAYVTSGTANLGIGLRQFMGTGGSPSTLVDLAGQLVALTTTPARYSVTFSLPTLTGKTLGTNGDDYTRLSFCTSCGSTNAALFGNPGVQSNTFAIWGVQLEIGSQATPLEKLDPRFDLANCLRFYQIGFFNAAGYGSGGAPFTVTAPMLTQMRATPTMTLGSISTANLTGVTVGSINSQVAGFTASVTATGYAGMNGGYTLSADF